MDLFGVWNDYEYCSEELTRVYIPLDTKKLDIEDKTSLENG